METPRNAVDGAPVPPTDARTTPLENDLRITAPDAAARTATPPAPRVVDTHVPAGERIERTVDTTTLPAPAPQIHEVRVDAPAPVATVPAERPGRLGWWIGGGALAAGTVAAAVRALVERYARPEPTAWERVRDSEATVPALALAAVGATGLGLADALRRRRHRREEDAAYAAVVPAPILLGDPRDEASEPIDLTAYEGDLEVDELADGEVETVPLPLEAIVLLDTLLDPVLAEGRDLPGAAALRAQLPHVETVAAALPQSEDEPVTDWLPLVVDEAQDLERAVPHDFTWPVRGRFTQDGWTYELTLMVIDGELGALVLTPIESLDDAEGDLDDDELPAAASWPGVQELAFHVDGELRR